MDASPPLPAPLPEQSPFRAIRRIRSFDEVVMQIQEAIARGTFRTGDRLPPERELCVAFDISRPTLREALRALEVLGTLEIRPGKHGGIYVARPNGDRVGSALAALIGLGGATAAELNEFRATFEGENAAWAARRATKEDVAGIMGIAERARLASESDATQWRDMVSIDLSFHQAVATASQNRVRVAVMLGILRAMERVELSITSIADPELHRSVGKELTAVAEAIRTRDPDGARKAMQRHVKRFGKMYLQIQEQAGRSERRRPHD